MRLRGGERRFVAKRGKGRRQQRLLLNVERFQIFSTAWIQTANHNMTNRKYNNYKLINAKDEMRTNSSDIA